MSFLQLLIELHSLKLRDYFWNFLCNIFWFPVNGEFFDIETNSGVMRRLL